MKKLSFLATLNILLFSISCTTSKSEQSDVPDGMVMLSLREYGKPFLLFVPDTSTAKLSVEENADGGLQITAGKNFAITVYEQHADLSLKKQDVIADEINKLKRIIHEDERTFVWESAITSPEHHFVYNITIGNSAYSFSDARGNQFSEAAISTMSASAASAHAE